MKVVIVGGVAGGASAAARIRRLDEHAQIIMIERSGYVSYANCGLPYYVGGVIEEQEELTLQTPESFWDRFRIDVRVRQEVTVINPAEKTVTVRTLDSGKSYTETYDKLLLAPGAKPTVPALSGVSSGRVFTLRTVEDTLRIRHFVEEQKPKTAVLAGGGFIGLEMAENLVEMGVSVTIVQRPKQLLAPLDADMASFVHAEMRRHGVALRLGETVTGFRQDGDSVLTLLEGSEPLHSDMVLLAIGVTPDTHLAKEAGLRLGIRGSIAVNERMETSVPDIYAVGDAVEVTHFVTGQKALISLAGPANKQGRIAADNICGGNSRFTGSQGSSVLKLFGLTAASTGINEKAAQAAGIAYDKVVLFPASHAAYYPGARSMAMKVLYEKESLRLLGAQIVGGDGVDKRIDVLATVIRAIMWRQKRCLLRKARIYRAFLLPKRRFFSVPKHRCKIAVFPLWIDLNFRKVNICCTALYEFIPVVVIKRILTVDGYNSTFFTTYKESGKRRLALAERLRKLPLAFFGKRDLADHISTITADCEVPEKACSHSS